MLRLVQDQRQRAHDLRAPAELPRHHVDLGRCARYRVAADRLGDRGEQDITGGTQIAADDHPLRIEDVAEVADRDADAAARVGDHALRKRIAGMRALDQLVHPDLLATDRVERARHGGGARHGLEAAAVAAAADLAVLAEERVAELARGAARAAVEPSLDDERAADAGAHAHEDEVLRAAAGAPDELGERAEVGVVLHAHDHPEPLAHRRGGVHAHPARQDRGRADGAVAARDRTRDAHADAEHALAVDPGLLERALDQLRGDVEAVARGGVDVDIAPQLGEDRVREVAHDPADVAVSEVDADDRAGGAIEREQHRRPADALVVAVALGRALDEQARALQVAYEARDGRARESRGARDVRSAGHAALP